MSCVICTVAVWSSVTVVVRAAVVVRTATLVLTAVVVVLVVVDTALPDSWCSGPGLCDAPEAPDAPEEPEAPDEPEEPEAPDEPDGPEEPEPDRPLDPLCARERDARELVALDVTLATTGAPAPADFGTVRDGPNVCVVDDVGGATTVVVPHPPRQIPVQPPRASLASHVRTIL